MLAGRLLHDFRPIKGAKGARKIEKMFFRHDELRDSVFLSMRAHLLIIDIEFQDKVYKEIEYIQGN